MSYIVSDIGSPTAAKTYLIHEAILFIFLGNHAYSVLYSTVRLNSGLILIKGVLVSHLSYWQELSHLHPADCVMYSLKARLSDFY